MPTNIRILYALAGMLVATAMLLLASPRACADPLPPNCVQQYWLYGLRGTTRTLCDGPIRADGSWERRRNFYADTRYVPVTCSWTRWGGGCSGGYTLPVFDTGIESYIVTPATVLPDEPGHIGNAGEVVR